MTGGPTVGPCGWPAVYAEGITCRALDSFGDDERASYEQMAATYLWNWTYRSFGLCDVVLRPCRTDCMWNSSFWGSRSGGQLSGGVGGTGWAPALVGGSWFNISCGTCGDHCSCGTSSFSTLRLPGPVHAINQILIDGAVVDPTTYRVDNERLLIRMDGGSWPMCQHMELSTTEDGTWEITYQRGLEVPMGGQVAAGVLACELAKAATNDSSCRLPSRIQTVTRQGVTIAVLDTFEGVEKGYTGIWVIDSWLASVVHPRRAGRVYSPDIARPRQRRTTWTSP